MKGIILSGGLGTRLYPSTISVSKQLIPIYDKPMIYYPLSILMMAGIREILIITTAKDLKSYKRLLGNGLQIGIKIFYKIQTKPRGLADAFNIGKKFIGKKNVCLILGDNIFYGDGLKSYLKNSINIVKHEDKAVIFTYPVSNPKNYGVLKSKNNKIISIIEKPKKFSSNQAVVGIYFYPNSVIKYIKLIKPSKRKELEITDLNNIFIKNKKLTVQEMGRGFSWHDAGSPDNLQEASQLIQIIEKRIGYKIGCIEEIALYNGWISKIKLIKIAKKYVNSEYGNYLNKLIKLK
jgi:glucose-1-phosphate thymidylyltransferase